MWQFQEEIGKNKLIDRIKQLDSFYNFNNLLYSEEKDCQFITFKHISLYSVSFHCL